MFQFHYLESIISNMVRRGKYCSSLHRVNNYIIIKTCVVLKLIREELMRYVCRKMNNVYNCLVTMVWTRCLKGSEEVEINESLHVSYVILYIYGSTVTTYKHALTQIHTPQLHAYMTYVWSCTYSSHVFIYTVYMYVCMCMHISCTELHSIV